MRPKTRALISLHLKTDKEPFPVKQQTQPSSFSKTQLQHVKSSTTLSTPTKLGTPNSTSNSNGFNATSSGQKTKPLNNKKNQSTSTFKRQQPIIQKDNQAPKMKLKKQTLKVSEKKNITIRAQPKEVQENQMDMATLVMEQNTFANITTTTVINNGIKNVIFQFKNEVLLAGSIRVEENMKSRYSLTIDGFAIGEGAHSTVYKSTDQKTQESYAMKFIPWTDNNDFIIQEINIMKLISTDHHFIQLKDQFLLKEGQKQQVVLLMELGQFNLSDIIQFRRKHSLSYLQKDLCNHMLWLLQGLNVLTKKQICHRDIKPSNIVYCESDNRFKITDFSEGKVFQYGKDGEHTLRGTPAFFSPEMRDLYQSRSLNGRYNPSQSDLFSLGLTFLCMATLDTNIQYSQINLKLNSIKVQYGNEIFKILENLLDNNCTNRFQFQEILEDNFFLGNDDDKIIYSKMAQDQMNLVANFENRFQKAQTIIDGYIKMQDYDNSLKQCDILLQDKETKKSPKHKILTLIRMSQIAGYQEDNDLAISLGQESLSLCNLLVEQSSEITGAALNTLGIAFSRTNATEAISLYKQAEDIAINKFGPFSAELSDVYNNIGSGYHRLQDHVNAKLYLDKALLIKRGILKDQDDIIGLCEVLNNVGIMCNKNKEYEEGEKHFIDSLMHIKQYMLQLNVNFHPAYIDCLANYTNSLIFQKKIKLTEQILDEWDKIVRKVFGDSDQQLNEIMGKYGMMYAMNQEFDKASTYFSNSLQLYINQNTEDDVEGHLDILFNYGCTLVHMGKTEHAKQLFQEALHLSRKYPQLQEHEESILNTLNILKDQ